MTPQEAIDRYRFAATRRRKQLYGLADWRASSRGREAYHGNCRAMVAALADLRAAGLPRVAELLENQCRLLDDARVCDRDAAKARRRSVRILDARIRELLTKEAG